MAVTTKPRRSITDRGKRSARAAAQSLKKAFKWVYSQLCTLGIWIAKQTRKALSGTKDEHPKVITKPASFGRVFWKCAIHLLPIFATITLAGLNFGTYFIGEEYLGNISGQWQAFDQLALQITAKLYELVIIASLATILMDILRYQLVSSPNGLPFGMLTAKSLFVDASYLASTDFRMGISGVTRKSSRAFLALLITTCSAVSLLAGPSSALLLIPRRYDNWGAGGATFHLSGTNDTLWPSQLDGQSIGGAHCQSPSESDLSAQRLDHSSCIWSGYQPLSQWWVSTHLGVTKPQIPIQDGKIGRVINLGWYPALSVAAFGVSVAPCTYAELLSAAWRYAILNAPIALSTPISKYSNLQYRARDGTTTSMDSQLPVVHTTCLKNMSAVFADVVGEIWYPLQPQYPVDYRKSVIAEGRTFNSSAVNMLQYSFSSPTYVNSSRIASIWLEAPKDEPLGTQIYTDRAVGRSSAYLNIQIPSSDNTTGIGLTCSIDAYWAQAQIWATNVAQVGSNAIYTCSDFPGTGFMFPAEDNGKWRSVRLGIDWLNALTPKLGDAEHWNTLSSTLDTMGMDNSTGVINTWDNAVTNIAAVISSVVADGMSRTGYEKNGGLINTTYTDISKLPGPESWDHLLDESYVLPESFEYDKDGAGKFEMKWSVAVTGLGYRVSGTAYRLAFVVLFLHASLALGHIFWVIVLMRGETSTAWSSLTDLVALAFRSTPPSHDLDNASGGVERFKTFKEPVRVRVVGSPSPNEGAAPRLSVVNDGVEMVFGSDYYQTKHTPIIKGQSY